MSGKKLKYKVGDKVQVKKTNYNPCLLNRVGAIVGIEDSYSFGGVTYPYEVKFPKLGNLKPTTFFFEEELLELVK